MIIIDDFVKDKRLLTKISHDPFFWSKGFHWWDGWWNTPIKSMRHELIDYIYRQHPMVNDINISGFEHWVGIYSANDGKAQESWVVPGGGKYHLEPHIDKDEGLYSETGELSTPTIGTVFYPDPAIDESEGGYLQIWNTHENNSNHPYELIQPKFNRLVIFDAGKLHAVQEVTKGVRKAIAINLWEQPLTKAKEMLS
jgi:hypothetical protein